ncbi:MAG: hypothetical protein A2V84_07120 [Chloroflexi bacterium RBG_16_70_13]|nr:MAG: hypothetical protein A2V84_07120 [Chloroflexi bacterium RBG_16_70_13]
MRRGTRASFQGQGQAAPGFGSSSTRTVSPRRCCSAAIVVATDAMSLMWTTVSESCIRNRV